MKGTPDLPQCGFSRASVQILSLQGVDPAKFAAYNVLEDEELRQGMLRLVRNFVKEKKLREVKKRFTHEMGEEEGIMGLVRLIVVGRTKRIL